MTTPAQLAKQLADLAKAEAASANASREETIIAQCKLDVAVRKNLSAIIEALGRVDDWQPIETAPKDGTRVMLWMEPMNDARFKPTDGSHAVSGSWVVWSDAMKREGMRDGWSWYGAALHYPTHWRPLPAPPALNEPTT